MSLSPQCMQKLICALAQERKENSKLTIPTNSAIKFTQHERLLLTNRKSVWMTERAADLDVSKDAGILAVPISNSFVVYLISENQVEETQKKIGREFQITGGSLVNQEDGKDVEYMYSLKPSYFNRKNTECDRLERFHGANVLSNKEIAVCAYLKDDGNFGMIMINLSTLYASIADSVYKDNRRHMEFTEFQDVCLKRWADNIALLVDTLNIQHQELYLAGAYVPNTNRMGTVFHNERDLWNVASVAKDVIDSSIDLDAVQVAATSKFVDLKEVTGKNYVDQVEQVEDKTSTTTSEGTTSEGNTETQRLFKSLFVKSGLATSKSASKTSIVMFTQDAQNTSGDEPSVDEPSVDESFSAVGKTEDEIFAAGGGYFNSNKTRIKTLKNVETLSKPSDAEATTLIQDTYYVYVPNSVKNIESWTFTDFSNLLEVHFQEGCVLETVNMNLTFSRTNIKTLDLSGLTLSSEIQDIDMRYMCYECPSLEILTLPALPNSVFSVNMSSMCNNCPNLKLLIFPDSLPNSALYIDMGSMCAGCSRLEILTLPPLPDSAFSVKMGAMCANCTRLSSIVLQSSLQPSSEPPSQPPESYSPPYAISSSASNGDFYIYGMCAGCTRLSSVALPSYLPNKLTSFSAENAFQNCTRLRSLYLPSTVSSEFISFWAGGMCDGCESLEFLILPSSLPNTLIRFATFNMCRGCSALTFLRLPSLPTSLPPLADDGTQPKTTFEMASMCDGCSNLSSITLPNRNNCSTAAFNAHNMFENCKSLETVTMDGFLPSEYNKTKINHMFNTNSTGSITISIGTNALVSREEGTSGNENLHIFANNKGTTHTFQVSADKAFMDTMKTIGALPNGSLNSITANKIYTFEVQSASTTDYKNEEYLSASVQERR